MLLFASRHLMLLVVPSSGGPHECGGPHEWLCKEARKPGGGCLPCAVGGRTGGRGDAGVAARWYIGEAPFLMAEPRPQASGPNHWAKPLMHAHC